MTKSDTRLHPGYLKAQSAELPSSSKKKTCPIRAAFQQAKMLDLPVWLYGNGIFVRGLLVLERGRAVELYAEVAEPGEAVALGQGHGEGGRAERVVEQEEEGVEGANEVEQLRARLRGEKKKNGRFFYLKKKSQMDRLSGKKIAEFKQKKAQIHFFLLLLLSWNFTRFFTRT